MARLVKKDGKWVEESELVAKDHDLPSMDFVNHFVRPKIVDITGTIKSDIKWFSSIKSSNDVRAVIKTKRKDLGISQDDLSKVLGINKQQYSRIESGSSVMNINQMMVIFDKLSITINIS